MERFSNYTNENILEHVNKLKTPTLKKLRITGWVFIYNGLVLNAKKLALKSCLVTLWMPC